jgi:hypothetical protein
VSPVTTPRLKRIINELGGVVVFTYGKSHQCHDTAPPYVQYPYDCYPAWHTTLGGFALWNKWKVIRQTQVDAFSANATQVLTYTYSTPINHYDDEGLAPSSQKSWSDFDNGEW